MGLEWAKNGGRIYIHVDICKDKFIKRSFF